MRGGRVRRVSVLVVVFLAASFLASLGGPARAAPLTGHAPITIASNADFTAANGVTGGHGTWDDPYVIAGWDIDASASNGITIANTDASFVMQDLAVHSGGTTYEGILFQNVANARVERVNSSGNADGLLLEPASNVTVILSTFSHNDLQGAFAFGGPGLLFANNTFDRNGNEGLGFLQASGVTALDNVVTGDPGSPIFQTGIGVSFAPGATVRGNQISWLTGTGLFLGDSAGVDASGNALWDNQYGMQVTDLTDSVVADNAFTSNTYGILASSSVRAGFLGNTFTSNAVSMYLQGMDSTVLNANLFDLNGRGIWQIDSTASTFTGNVFTGDGLTILGSTPAAYDSHNITPDNLVNGAPIRYYANAAGIVVDHGPVGQVLVADCTDVTIEGLQIDNTDAPITVAFSTSVDIVSNALANDWNSIYVYGASPALVAGNTLSGVTYGVFVFGGQAADVRGNAISAARYGIYLGGPDGASVAGNSIDSARIAGIAVDAATNSILSTNTISGAFDGITVASSQGIQLTQNTISASSRYGISLSGSTSVDVFHNALEGNAVQASVDTGTSATWDHGYPSGGNFWSDYGGVDLCSGPAQNVCTAPDGIGDTPYVIDASNVDGYPLMAPASTPPPVAAFTVHPSLGGAGASFSVDASTSTDPNGPTSALLFRWDWDGDGTFDTSWSTSPTASHVYAADGAYTIRLQVMGADGLTGDATHAVVYDATPPVTAALPSGVLGSNAWFQSGVTVTLAASDALSGVASTSYRIDGGAWVTYTGPFPISGDGMHTLEYFSTDAAGNVEAVKSLAVNIDTVAPTVAASLTGSQGKSPWYRSPVGVTLTASDATSGVASIAYRLDGGAWITYTGPFLVTGAGVHTLDFRATDNAGNASAVRSIQFTIKK